MIFLKVSRQAPHPSNPVSAGNGSPEPLMRRQQTCLPPLCKWKSEIDGVGAELNGAEAVPGVQDASEPPTPAGTELRKHKHRQSQRREKRARHCGLF